MRVTVTESTAIPVGEYGCRVTGVEQETGQYGAQFRWKFEVVKPDEFRGKPLSAWSSTSSSVKSKFTNWAAACLGRAIAAGENIDTEELVGKAVLVTVIVKEGEDGGEFNKVEGLRVYRRTAPAPAPVVVAPPADEFVDITDPFADQ